MNCLIQDWKTCYNFAIYILVLFKVSSTRLCVVTEYLNISLFRGHMIKHFHHDHHRLHFHKILLRCFLDNSLLLLIRFLDYQI